jgi:hypothetical protein
MLQSTLAYNSHPINFIDYRVFDLYKVASYTFFQRLKAKTLLSQLSKKNGQKFSRRCLRSLESNIYQTSIGDPLNAEGRA